MATEIDVQEYTLERLSKELKKVAAKMTADEARYLVADYYLMQEQRIRAGSQIRAKSKEFLPTNYSEMGDEEKEKAEAQALAEATKTLELLAWFNRNADVLEAQVRRALDAYSNNYRLGRWARSIMGIGPVIAAGLLAHIDITKAPTAGHIWAFAGLDPSKVWDGGKRPWNAALKTLCWKIGDSFSKQRNREGDVYGHILAERQEWESKRSSEGAYAAQAAKVLQVSPTHKQAKTYAAGQLPKGHILSRARRYAVKLFLAHYHHVAYELKFGTPPPKPYIIAFGKHAHYIAPPNWPMPDDGSDLPPMP